MVNSLPNRCLLCHQHTHNESNGLCLNCLHACLYQNYPCLGCGKSMTVLSVYCGNCLAKTPLPVIAPASYHSPIGSLVAAIKYQQQFAPLSLLVKALIHRVRITQSTKYLPKPQILLPVPLHHQRLKERGFNQAYLIAAEIAQKLNIPIDTTSLIRTRHTPPQAQLNGRNRRNNLKNAFHLDANFPWQKVAIIDDVVTTGSTVNEINQLLKKRHIHGQVWCLAKSEYNYK